MIIILITRNTEKTAGRSTPENKSREEEARTLLLREGLRQMGRPAYAEHFTPDLLSHTQDGKPYISELPDLYFNLSHSGDYIACAFSDREVGLDLQEHSRMPASILRISKRFFTGPEYEAILALPSDENADNPDNSACRIPLFYRLWSIKEAYLKYLGCGLRGGMNNFLPAADSAADISADKLLRGTIRVIGDDPLLTPAEYASVEAPDNYTMVVCAQTLPREIIVKTI